MDFSQERNKPLFMVREANGATKFVSIKDIEGNHLVTPDFKKKMGSLTQYLISHLGLKSLPSSVKMVNSKKNSDNPFGLTGYYDHDTKQITLFITDRHETDILRTFSHEMIHHWQNERGVLHPENKDTGEKNDTSPHYAQNNFWLRKREMEAYLFGCLLFRDWQDEQRMGTPKTQPVLPQPYD